jgi:hypothetical protein
MMRESQGEKVQESRREPGDSERRGRERTSPYKLSPCECQQGRRYRRAEESQGTVRGVREREPPHTNSHHVSVSRGEGSVVQQQQTMQGKRPPFPLSYLKET